MTRRIFQKKVVMGHCWLAWDRQPHRMGLISPKFTDLELGVYLKPIVCSSSRVSGGGRWLLSEGDSPHPELGGWITLWMLLPFPADNGRKEMMISGHVPLRSGCCQEGWVLCTDFSPLRGCWRCACWRTWGCFSLLTLHLPWYSRVKSQYCIASGIY